MVAKPILINGSKEDPMKVIQKHLILQYETLESLALQQHNLDVRLSKLEKRLRAKDQDSEHGTEE